MKRMLAILAVVAILPAGVAAGPGPGGGPIDPGDSDGTVPATTDLSVVRFHHANSTVTLRMTIPFGGTAPNLVEVRYGAAAFTAAEYAQQLGGGTAALASVPGYARGVPVDVVLPIPGPIVAETTYWFATRNLLQTVSGGVTFSIASAVSNIASGVSFDAVSPETSTLDIDEVTENSARARWDQAGDDGWTGTPTAFLLRYSSVAPSPTGGNVSWFRQATPVSTSSVPLVGGHGPAEVVITNLPSGTTLYVAVVTEDEGGNWSALSTIRTLSTLVPAAPPIEDLGGSGSNAASSAGCGQSAPGGVEVVLLAALSAAFLLRR